MLLPPFGNAKACTMTGMTVVRSLIPAIAALAVSGTLPSHAEAPHFKGFPAQAEWRNETPGWSAADSSLTVVAGRKTDWFQWPGGGYHADSAPQLLFKADGDFSFSTKVEVTGHKTFDAGCVALYGTATHWAKLCLEVQDGGGLSVISVVTRELSDDVTSFPVAGTSTWLKVAKDKDVLFFYASTDGKAWMIVRKFNLQSADGFQVGFAAQSPDGEGASARFTDFRYDAGPVNLWSLRSR
jgi:regulation of enolase protein 1 (concanavalin A-like superfamily)